MSKTQRIASLVNASPEVLESEISATQKKIDRMYVQIKELKSEIKLMEKLKKLQNLENNTMADSIPPASTFTD